MDTAMPTDSSSYALLKLLQLASPALPVGAYSYSEGIETLVDNGTISNEPRLWAILVILRSLSALLLAGGKLPYQMQYLATCTAGPRI